MFFRAMLYTNERETRLPDSSGLPQTSAQIAMLSMSIGHAVIKSIQQYNFRKEFIY